MENASVNNVPRVKYKTSWKGTINNFLLEHPDIRDVYNRTVDQLSEALQLLEWSGAAPVLADGKVAGNAAARIVTNSVDILIVSRSGKTAGQPINVEEDFCIVTNFNADLWHVDYYAKLSSILPTSDAPLHHAALYSSDCYSLFDVPYVSLHGHALASGREAEQMSFPCSTTETLFSTPDDRRELLLLLTKYKYPDEKIFIRKGHGFVILAGTVVDAMATFKTSILPLITP